MKHYRHKLGLFTCRSRDSAYLLVVPEDGSPSHALCLNGDVDDTSAKFWSANDLKLRQYVRDGIWVEFDRESEADWDSVLDEQDNIVNCDGKILTIYPVYFRMNCALERAVRNKNKNKGDSHERIQSIPRSAFWRHQ